MTMPRGEGEERRWSIYDLHDVYELVNVDVMCTVHVYMRGPVPRFAGSGVPPAHGMGVSTRDIDDDDVGNFDDGDVYALM